MFGFSLSKLLVLVLIVVAVWYGYKWVTRMRKLHQARQAERVRSGRADSVEDMIRCPKCEAFVIAGQAKSCGRDDCPYGA